MDMPAYALHPQSLLMETTWVCSWFERLLEKASTLDSDERRRAVFVADRSPFSAVFYSRRKGHLLEPLIREHIEEVREEAAVHIVTVHLQVEPELLWGRIQERLVREPFRARYREGEREWMETAQCFYDGFGWDITLCNGEEDMASLLEQCLTRVAAVSDPVRSLVIAACPETLASAVLADSESPSSQAAAAASAAFSSTPSLPQTPSTKRGVSTASAETLGLEETVPAVDAATPAVAEVACDQSSPPDSPASMGRVSPVAMSRSSFSAVTPMSALAVGTI